MREERMCIDQLAHTLNVGEKSIQGRMIKQDVDLNLACAAVVMLVWYKKNRNIDKHHLFKINSLYQYYNSKAK